MLRDTAEATQIGVLSPISLFFSHAHRDSAVVQQTASVLSQLGVRPFVAARNIRPATEWLRRLERELINSDALVAFLSPAFRASAWADQELGFALAKGKNILPVQLNSRSAPHGFIWRYQAVQAMSMAPQDIAVTILDWLPNDKGSRQKLMQIITLRFRNERSGKSLRFWTERLARVPGLTDQERSGIMTALEINSVIRTDPSLKADIQEIVQRAADETEPGAR